MNLHLIGSKPAPAKSIRQALAFILGVTALAIIACILNH